MMRFLHYWRIMKTNDELLKIPLDEMLSMINFKSITVVTHGDGWVGTRYVLKTYNYGSSYQCKSFNEMKEWIVNNISFQLHD